MVLTLMSVLTLITTMIVLMTIMIFAIVAIVITIMIALMDVPCTSNSFSVDSTSTEDNMNPSDVQGYESQQFCLPSALRG